MITLFAVTLAAHAAPPRWGVGPHLGTTALPAGSPIALPRDLPADSTLGKAHVDLLLGAGGYVWTPGGALRGGVLGDVDLAARFVRGQILLTVERSFDLDSAMVNVGGGFGFSSARWRGTDADERLRVPSYPVRIQGGVVAPISDFIAVEGRLFGTLDVPLRHRYWGPTGAESEVAGVPFSYFVVGIEVAGLYGLFR